MSIAWLFLVAAQLAATAPAPAAAHRSPVAPVRAAAAASGPSLQRLPAAAPEQPRSAADSVYRLARRALEREAFEQAATLFAQLRTKFAASGYAEDAGYWEGYARYRLGGPDDLEAARDILQRQVERYPKAATRTDARSLLARVSGQLARTGDAASAEALATSTSEMAAQLEALSSQRVSVTARATSPRMSALRPLGGGDDEEPSECKAGETDERIEALNALMQVDGDRAVPVLARVLKRRDPCSVRLRRKAVFIVAQQRRAGAEEVLLEAVRTDPDRQVREQAVFWLGQVGTDRAVAVLDTIVQSTNDVAVRRKAVFAMAQLKVAGAGDKLAAYAGRQDLGAEVQGEALQWLGQRDGGAALVRQLFPRLQDDELKERALFAASQGRDESGPRWLLEVARDARQSNEIRKKALFWAGQSRALDLAALDGFYTAKDANRELKQHYAFVLSQRREPEAADRLMTIAKSDPDREVRKKAIFWLSQSKDPRVARFLEDLIANP